jgi:His/Glu/Gln/Arg/opine family amino acid ABC transporter permease subunit
MDFGFLASNLRYLLDGLGLTIALAALSFVGCLVVGTCLALLRLSPWWWLRWPVGVYIDVLRMVPLIMVIFWFFFLLPIVIGRPVGAFVAGLAGLIAFHSTYIAEVIRAGIHSVPHGLVEASRCSGMRYRHCLWHIVLPIATRNMLPALVNRFVSLFMGTSLVYVIGVTDFFRAATNVNMKAFRPYEVYIFVALVYFVFCYSLSRVGALLERRLALAGAR